MEFVTEQVSCYLIKGPFTNDVSREGEGGGWPISDERKRGCVNLVLTRGAGGGPKSQKFS